MLYLYKFVYMKKLLITATLLTLTVFSHAQDTTVEIDLATQRFVGDISTLNREKYFSVHDVGSDPEQTAFRNDYNVTGGRQFWGPFGYAYDKSSEEPSQRQAGVYPPDKAGNDNVKDVKKGIVGTSHPNTAFVDGLDVVAAANWVVEYNKDYVSNGEATEFIEVMNEPFVHARDFYPGWNISENNRIKAQMAQLYNEVGIKVHESPALANMKVIGYSSAWPSMELDDFNHWEENMKMFMDTAGANMDGFSTHLYDGINVTGQDTKRSGSNSEAILDLIENYSYIKWGSVKPHAITEYGAIEDGYGDDYSDIASAQTMVSINHILFNLLNREDRLVNSIPFITGKATWHITAENNYQPYQAVLWKPTNIGEPTPAGWEYTPRIHFYELWKDVKGQRVFIKSDNPDIQTHAFLDKATNKLYVALSNLDDNTHNVALDFISELPGVTEVKTKALKIYPQSLPDMSITTGATVPTSISLIKDETVVIECTFGSAVSQTNAIKDKNYYSQNYLRQINANNTLSYNFNNVDVGQGYATLRMSIARKHNVSKSPVVQVNGTTVSVPSNWKGYDQANRDDFFGMIEIPFDASLLQTNNTITLEFPDSGGRVSSLILTTSIYGNYTEFFGQDAIDFETLNDVYESDSVLPINITYTSNVEIPVHGIQLVLWSVSNPWSQLWLKTQKNQQALPAGANQTITMNVGGLPSSVLNSNGKLMTDTELFAENPNSALVGTPNYEQNTSVEFRDIVASGGTLNDYFYELRLFINQPAVDAGFGVPSGKASTSFISVEPTLSNNNSPFLALNLYPNPTEGFLILPENVVFEKASIYNLSGQKVKEVRYQKKIDVSQLTNGTYIILTDTKKVAKFLKK